MREGRAIIILITSPALTIIHYDGLSGGLGEISTDWGTGDTDMNGTGTFFALFPAASKKLKEQDYRSISPSITLKTVKIYLSRDT